MSALAIAADEVLGRSRLWAQQTTDMMSVGTIDVHHHYFPTAFQADTEAFMNETFGSVPPLIKNWTPERDTESMDKNGIAMAVINTSSRPPAAGVSTDRYLTQARQANEYAAKMVQTHPKRFAQFGFCRYRTSTGH